MQEYKKPLLIGLGVVGVGLGALFLKNYIQEKQFKPMERNVVVKAYKQLRKHDYLVYRQIAMVAAQIASQFKQLTPQMIKGYLEGPESPLKVSELFQKNKNKVCEHFKISNEQFQYNLQHYKDDPELAKLMKASEREMAVCLTGRIPNVDVKVPENLTKQRVLEIQTKMIRQKYLFQVAYLKKLRQYGQKQLQENPELLKDLPNPQSEQQMLEDENIGDDDQPASAVLHAAIVKYKTEEAFRQALTSIENSFKNIFSRYEAKISSNRITQNEITQLEDQLIYYQYIG